MSSQTSPQEPAQATHSRVSILGLPMVGQTLSLVNMPVVLEGLPGQMDLPATVGLAVLRRW